MNRRTKARPALLIVEVREDKGTEWGKLHNKPKTFQRWKPDARRSSKWGHHWVGGSVVPFSPGNVKCDSHVSLALTAMQLASPLTKTRTWREKPVWAAGGGKESGQVKLQATGGNL